MDQSTKTFVIAACSVVIAAPLVWLGLEFLKARRMDEIQRTTQQEAAEQERQDGRTMLCNDKAATLFPPFSEPSLEEINEKSQWISSCIQSITPVETFAVQ